MAYPAGSAQLETETAFCDLRSDTVTRPDAAMRQAMAEAEVGDDVFGEDPTIARLEASLAERLGKDAGLFCPSGTQSNLLGLLSHCGRGQEIITGKAYHVFKYEAGGASALGGIVFDALPVGEDGGLSPAAIAEAAKEDDPHFPVSRLLSLENTHNGKALPVLRLEEMVAAARGAGLNAHLDGARVFNAACALHADVAEIAAPFDTVSVCLSKGLGAPVGSVLVGPKEMIAQARRWRKMVGGGMRQAGILAAAGLYALEHNVSRLAEDYARAEMLAALLRKAGAGEVTQATNMVFFTPHESDRSRLAAEMAEAGIVMPIGTSGATRLVLHKDVSEAGFDHLLSRLGQFYGQ